LIFGYVQDKFYVYYTVKAYRNEKGKPTSDIVLIEKLVPNGVSLIPNNRYFELFPTATKNAEQLNFATISTHFDVIDRADFKRLKAHIQATTEGKAFVGFIILILRICMHNLLLNDMNTKT